MGLEERTASAGPRPERPHAHADWRQMLGIGVVVSILGIAAGLLIDWFPVQASGQARHIDTLWDVLIIFSVPVFVLVLTIVVFSAVKFRMRPGEENLDGPPIHGNTRLEVVWTAIPAMILVGLCTYAFVVLQNVEKAEANTMQVRVVGQQFSWTFYYKRDGEDKEIASSQLFLPKDRPVQFTLQSKDVLHDFWVPAFRMKKDVVPGIDVRYRITPNLLGSYPIVCAELCGLGHAVMRATVHVVTADEFTKWVGALGKPAAPAAGGAAPETDGKAIFTAQSNGCSACHTLSDAGTTGTVGPDLDKVLVGKDEAFIKESIIDPDKEIADGYQGGVMPPNFGQTLQPAQIDALVKYLSEVTKGG